MRIIALLMLVLSSCTYNVHYIKVFPFQRQQQSQWCWASGFQAALLMTKGVEIKQCEIANVREAHRVDCCKNPELCNDVLYGETEWLASEFDLRATPLKYTPSQKEIVNTLKSGATLLIAIARNNGRYGHMLIIGGVRGNDILIYDPGSTARKPYYVNRATLINNPLYGEWWSEAWIIEEM